MQKAESLTGSRAPSLCGKLEPLPVHVCFFLSTRAYPFPGKCLGTMHKKPLLYLLLVYLLLILLFTSIRLLLGGGFMGLGAIGTDGLGAFHFTPFCTV